MLCIAILLLLPWTLGPATTRYSIVVTALIAPTSLVFTSLFLSPFYLATIAKRLRCCCYLFCPVDIAVYCQGTQAYSLTHRVSKLEYALLVPILLFCIRYFLHSYTWIQPCRLRMHTIRDLLFAGADAKALGGIGLDAIAGWALTKLSFLVLSFMLGCRRAG